jgi:hypothetical protein
MYNLIGIMQNWKKMLIMYNPDHIMYNPDRIMYNPDYTESNTDQEKCTDHVCSSH